MNIRPEQPADIPGIHAVNAAAFPTDAEAKLVDTMRERDAHTLSLVAVNGDQVIGHILFSPALLEFTARSMDIIGLAPMSVLPDHQNSGIGSKLVLEGLSQLDALGEEIVIVLGHPDYYPRFDFEQADQFGITCEFPSAPEAFMIRGIDVTAWDTSGALARYHPAFQSL